MYSACSGTLRGDIPLEFHSTSNVLMLELGKVFTTTSLSFCKKVVIFRMVIGNNIKGGSYWGRSMPKFYFACERGLF